jgi:hypothetical protein
MDHSYQPDVLECQGILCHCLCVLLLSLLRLLISSLNHRCILIGKVRVTSSANCPENPSTRDNASHLMLQVSKFDFLPSHLGTLALPKLVLSILAK